MVWIIPVPFERKLVLLCSLQGFLLHPSSPHSLLLSPLQCHVAYCCHSLCFRGGPIVPRMGQFRICSQERGATDARGSCRNVTGLWPTVPDTLKEGIKPTAAGCKMICPVSPQSAFHVSTESLLPAHMWGDSGSAQTSCGIPSRCCPQCWEHSRSTGPSSSLVQPWKSSFQHGHRRARRAGCPHLLWSLL